MYLKWLVDREGCRVEKSEAVQAFNGRVPDEVVSTNGWTFVPMLGLNLNEWVDLLMGGW